MLVRIAPAAAALIPDSRNRLEFANRHWGSSRYDVCIGGYRKADVVREIARFLFYKSVHNADEG